MAMFETWLHTDLTKPIHVVKLQGVLFNQDNFANLIGVEVLNNGQPVALEGDVAAYIIREDGQTLNITPSMNMTGKDVNRAWVVLPDSAYSVVGVLSIVIKLENNGAKTTLAACTGYVSRSTTSDAVAPPWHHIPDLSELEQAISQAQTAATNANNAAQYVAPVESDNTADAAHAVGTYFIYDGKLMKATAPIAQGATIVPYASGAMNFNCAEVPGGLSGDVYNVANTANAAANNAADAQQLVAPVESDNTADEAHAVGTYFVYDGKLMMATSAIAQGATIVPYASGVANYNCAEETGGLAAPVATNKTLAMEGISKAGIVGTWTAPAESGTIATSAHAVGNYFTYNGYLYRATTAIAEGATIVTTGENANCALVPGGLSSAVLENHNEIGLTAADIATVETRYNESVSTASAAHATGSYFVFGGALYKATADIAIGDSLAATGSGANIAQVPGGAMGEVTSLNSAFVNDKKGIMSFDLIPNSYVTITGVITPYNNWKRTDYTYVGDCGSLVAKTSASSNYNCFYDSSKTFISWFNVGTSDTEIVVPENAEYVIFSNTNAGMNNLTASFVTKVKTDVENVENRLVSDEYEINAVRSAFGNNVTPFALSAFTSGKYIDNSGTEQTSSSMTYTSCDITAEDVGKTIYISGSAWNVIEPFVFVGTSGKIVRSTVDDASTPTQYTDLVFSPPESGTLYINRYASGSNVQIAKAYYNAIGNLSENNFSDAVSYKPVSLGTLINSKLLNAATGEITDGTSDLQKVTDYIDVSGDTYYLITTENFYEQGLYAWYDASKNFISGEKSGSGSTHTQIHCKRVKSPSNAAYLVIGFHYQPSFAFPFLMEGKMNAAYPSQRWHGLKWTGIGDSLTEAYSVTGAHYFDLICAATGISFVNKGVSGTGYAKGTSNFMTRALTVDSDSDVVTFFGSGNDASSGLSLGNADDTGTETIAGCINTAIDNIYSVNPIMNIGIITPTPWQNNMPYDNGFMESYSNLIVHICKLRSIPCLDLFHCSGLNPNSSAVRAAAYSRDDGHGTHPDENGHALFAPRILSFLDSLLMH